MSIPPNEAAPYRTSPRPALFLAASVPNGSKEYPGCERHRETARPQWIRDAVLAIARGAFSVEFDLIFGAHPSISPMLLAVAREYPLLAEPRITVFRSEHFAKAFPPETLELTDPQLGLGQLVPFPDHGDPQTSLLAMRTAMLQCSGLCAAVFVGGMDGLFDEAGLFRHHNPTRPAYAIASAGGAAADLLDRPTSANQPGQSPPSYQAVLRYPPDHFSGAPQAPIDPDALRAQNVGYTRAARTIIETLRAALHSKAVTART